MKNSIHKQRALVEHVAKLKAELKRLKTQQRLDRRERYKRFQQLRDTLKSASTSTQR